MANDGLTLHTIAEELNDLLNLGKVSKIFQPNADEIILQIYANSKNHRLLISCNANSPRIHLTTLAKENPLTPPQFCNSLRKHLSNATFIKAEQNAFERVIKLNFLSKNELFDSVQISLIVEIMGKHSNIILANEKNIIIACAKFIPLDVSSKRQILCGLEYQPAPSQNKLSLLDQQAIKQMLENNTEIEIPYLLFNGISGLSTATAKEICSLSDVPFISTKLENKQVENILKVLNGLYHLYKSAKFSPCTTLDDNNIPTDFMPFEYASLKQRVKTYGTMSEAIENCLSLKELHQSFICRSKSLMQSLKTAINRLSKKKASVLETLNDSDSFENTRIIGEILTSNLYKIKQGMDKIVVENYYLDPPQEIIIELDKTLSPSQNAQRFFKKYNKKKTAFEYAKNSIFEIEENLSYYNSILQSFQTSTSSAELNEIAMELESAGIVKQQQNTKKKTSNQKSSPLKFIVDGFTIYVGKNNLQNDNLTKNAKGEDLWLHALDTSGSHVIIENPLQKDVPNLVVQTACELAAFYSKNSASDKVAVDMTKRKFIKRTPGNKLGFVTYTNQTTFNVKPKKFSN